MIWIILAAAATAAVPKNCPVGAHVVSSYVTELPLYDDAGAVAVTIKAIKGAVTPPLLISDCEGPYLYVQVDGRELAVERLSVRFDQPLAIPICDPSVAGGKEGTAPQRSLGAMDHHCIEKKP